MSEIRKYVIVHENNSEGDHEYDDPNEAITQASKLGRTAVIARVYVFDDSDLVWTSTGDKTWPPPPPAPRIESAGIIRDGEIIETFTNNEDQDEAESIAQSIEGLYDLGRDNDVEGLEAAFREWVLRQHIDINLDNVDFEALARFLQE